MSGGRRRPPRHPSPWPSSSEQRTLPCSRFRTFCPSAATRCRLMVRCLGAGIPRRLRVHARLIQPCTDPRDFPMVRCRDHRRLEPARPVPPQHPSQAQRPALERGTDDFHRRPQPAPQFARGWVCVCPCAAPARHGQVPGPPGHEAAGVRPRQASRFPGPAVPPPREGAHNCGTRSPVLLRGHHVRADRPEGRRRGVLALELNGSQRQLDGGAHANLPTATPRLRQRADPPSASTWSDTATIRMNAARTSTTVGWSAAESRAMRSRA
jgi:hypothetical protein